MSVLREDEVDGDLVPEGVHSSFRDYMELIYEKAYFDYTEIINLAVQFLEGDDEDAERVRGTSVLTSATSSSTSTRMSTRRRSASSAD